MSSYFDRAQMMFEQAMKMKDESKAALIMQTALDKYEKYLLYIRDHMYKADQDKLVPIQMKFQDIKARPLIDDYARATLLSFALEDLHSLAHILGNAQIRMKGRVGRALDNPYWPNMNEDMIEESFHAWNRH